MNFGDTGQAMEKACDSPTLSKARSQKEQLRDQRAHLSERVAQIDEALAILEKNPEIERLLTIMRNF